MSTVYEVRRPNVHEVTMHGAKRGFMVAEKAGENSAPPAHVAADEAEVVGHQALILHGKGAGAHPGASVCVHHQLRLGVGALEAVRSQRGQRAAQAAWVGLGWVGVRGSGREKWVVGWGEGLCQVAVARQGQEGLQPWQPARLPQAEQPARHSSPASTPPVTGEQKGDLRHLPPHRCHNLLQTQQQPAWCEGERGWRLGPGPDMQPMGQRAVHPLRGSCAWTTSGCTDRHQEHAL